MNIVYLLLGIPLVLSLFGFFFYLYKYRNLNKLYKEKTSKYNEDKKSFNEYVNRIKHHLTGGNQLREGLIIQDLVKDQGQQTEQSFTAITEVKEVERTLHKSKIKVTGARAKFNTDPTLYTTKDASLFYDGWIDSNKIEWHEKIDGREELIDQILNEIEQDENK